MLVAALCIETYFSMTVVPKYERMFEDMLGTRDKLPTVASAFIQVSRWQQGNILLVALPILAGVGFLVWHRRKTWARVISGVLAAALALYSVVGFVGLQMPALQLVQSLDVPAP